MSRTPTTGLRSRSAEHVVQRDGLKVAAGDELAQLVVAVRDGRQVGVGQHDLLREELPRRSGDEAGLVLRERIADGVAPQCDGRIAEIGGHAIGGGGVHTVGRPEVRSAVGPYVLRMKSALRWIWSWTAVRLSRLRYGCDQVWFPIWIWPESTIGRSAGALSDHDALAPFTKKVSRVPVSLQNWPKAATTALLAPSSTVRANWLPSPGSRISTPTGAGTRASGTISRTAPATGGRVTAATTPAAIAASMVRRSTPMPAIVVRFSQFASAPLLLVYWKTAVR